MKQLQKLQVIIWLTFFLSILQQVFFSTCFGMHIGLNTDFFCQITFGLVVFNQYVLNGRLFTAQAIILVLKNKLLGVNLSTILNQVNV